MTPLARPSSDPRSPRNVTSVGALVRRADSLLVVKMLYGPSRGRYMIPGGLVDPGETLDVAVAREVLEETGVAARPVGIVGVRSRVEGLDTDSYVIWLLEPLEDGVPTPVPDGREIEDTRFLTFDEIEARDDVVYLVKYLAQRLRDGELAPHRYVENYEQRPHGTTEATWRLFM